MTKKFLQLGLVTLVATSIHAAPAWSARIKCWTNNDGVRECGNVVPPEYSQKRRTELNSRGLTVKTYRRAKTKAEVAEEKRLAEAAAAKKKEEERIARERAFRDRVLLDTFTTEEDLLLAHQGRLATIDSRVKHTRQIIAGLEEELKKLRSEAADQERAGKTVSEKLQREIAGREKRITENLSFIDARRKEKIQLQAQYEKDLARYRTLKKQARSR